MYATLNHHLFFDPFADARRVALEQLRYRGVVHERRPARTVPAAPTPLVYRGIRFLRFACRPKRIVRAEPGTLCYRGVTH